MNAPTTITEVELESKVIEAMLGTGIFFRKEPERSPAEHFRRSGEFLISVDISIAEIKIKIADKDHPRYCPVTIYGIWNFSIEASAYAKTAVYNALSIETEFQAGASDDPTITWRLAERLQIAARIANNLKHAFTNVQYKPGVGDSGERPQTGE